MRNVSRIKSKYNASHIGCVDNKNPAVCATNNRDIYVADVPGSIVYRTVIKLQCLSVGHFLYLLPNIFYRQYFLSQEQYNCKNLSCMILEIIYNERRGLVAQWLERSAHNALVVGSSPT